MPEKLWKCRTKVLVILALLLAGGALFLLPGALRLALASMTANASALELSPGEAPRQDALPPSASRSITLERDGATWQLTPRAGYRIAARVLHSKVYDDWQAGLSPVDLALGWGMLSDARIDDWIQWDQDNRWYYYNYRRVLSVPFPREYVRDHSANVHIIPATESLEAVLRELRGNEIVLLDGLLVDVEARRAAGMVAFRTSLSRYDEGDESCEIMYVERVVKDGVEYR